MKNKGIKLIAMSVAMILGAQGAISAGVTSWSELQAELKNSTSAVNVAVEGVISATETITLGNN